MNLTRAFLVPAVLLIVSAATGATGVAGPRAADEQPQPPQAALYCVGIPAVYYGGQPVYTGGEACVPGPPPPAAS